MNITVRNEYRVEVLLSASELDAYGVTYDELDYSRAETRRVLWAIANEIRRLSGTDFTLSGKLLIEVFKENSGSTRICFTHLEKENDPKSIKQLIKCEAAPVAVSFCDIENVIGFCSAVKNQGESLLFEENGTYILILFLPCAYDAVITAAVSEYGSLCENSRIVLARCEEMKNCIIPHNAVETIRKAFSESQQQPFCHP